MGAYQRLSRNAGGLGHRDEALAAAEKAVELDPLSAIVHADLGRALVSVGRFDEAAHRFRKANEIDPDMPMPYRQAGLLAAYARNRFADAVPLLQKAAALDPDNPLLELYRSRIFFDLGDDVAVARAIEAARAGWRGPYWRYARDFDTSLASIRNKPEFKDVFADIERDMARQRAELTARPMDASLNLDLR